MGCLNDRDFGHWFGNIHLSGPCNRECYFCIGQHMMALDPLNTLDQWPLPGIEEFVRECNKRGITEVNLTGSNTDPLLYKHVHELRAYLEDNLDTLSEFGVRTNGALVFDRAEVWSLFDKATLSIHSFDEDIYREMMGRGTPPDLPRIVEQSIIPIKLNVCISPFNTSQPGLRDLDATIIHAISAGVDKINLRELYGQEHVGDPLKDNPLYCKVGETHSMPTYKVVGETSCSPITYWDVHYCHVSSVNVYANGRVSMDYPVTRGHSEDGEVQSQLEFKGHKRRTEQWVKL